MIDKVHEEIEELLAAQTEAERTHEIGDILFVVAVWARWLGLNPEVALREANHRFYKRFTYIEQMARDQGRPMSDLSFDEMEKLWQEAKKL